MMEKCRKALDIYNEFVRKYSLEKYIGKYLEMDKEEKYIENNVDEQVKKYADKNTEEYMEKDADFLRSYIYDIMIENIEYAGKYNYDEIMEYRRKCNYELLAENKINMFVLSDDVIIDIWKEAASSYFIVNNYRKVSECRIKALPNMLRIYEKDKNEEFKSTYYYLMWDIINAFIDDKDIQNAFSYIEKFYDEFMNYIINNKNGESERSDMVRIMSEIAFLILDLNYMELTVKPNVDYKKMALDKCLCELYLVVIENIDVDLIKNINNSEEQIEKMYQSIMKVSCKDITTEKIDMILTAAEDISVAVYTETKQDDKYKIYRKIADYFIDKYGEKDDIEFR